MIWCKNSDGNILRYYGSTANFIKRKSQHKINYERWVKAGRPSKNKCSSFFVLNNGDWRMDKIEEIYGERWEASKKEGEYIKNNDCVNLNIASRTSKEYYKDNRNELNKKHKQYYETHKDEILEKLKEKIICECGAKVAKYHISSHRRTKKHINFINSN